MKKGGYLSSFHVPFLSYDPQIVLKSAFLQFCANPSEICNSIQVICIYASKRSRYARSENGIVYSTMTYCFGDIRV